MRFKSLAAWLLFILVSGGTGVGVGLLDARFGVFDNLGQRLGVAARSFSVPSDYPNPDRGAGQFFAVDDCTCRRDNWQCPCPAVRPESSAEAEIAEALSQSPMPVSYGPTESFTDRLLSATGYDSIRAAEDAVLFGREEAYLGGKLREVFFHYDIPSLLVRGLVLTHEGSSTDTLFIHTPASWTKAETPLGIGDPMYLRAVGRDVFEAGYDVVSLDHGSNGGIESALNGYAIMTSGVQSYGLWARSTCDAVAMLEEEGRTYERVVVYGLSRGNHTVEYIRALCDRIDIAFGDDTWFVDAYVEPYWRSDDPLVHASKYGSFFFHAQALIGPMSAHDLAAQAANPDSRMIFFLDAEKIDEMLPDLRRSFSVEDGFGNAPLLMAVKRTDQHVPENDQILEILRGDVSQIDAISLMPMPGGQE